MEAYLTDSTIIVAAIAAAGSLGGSLIGVITSSKLTTYKLQKLEEEVKKHNSVIERVYKLEQHNEVQDTEIKNIAGDVKELKEYHKGS